MRINYPINNLNIINYTKNWINSNSTLLIQRLANHNCNRYQVIITISTKLSKNFCNFFLLSFHKKVRKRKIQKLHSGSFTSELLTGLVKSTSIILVMFLKADKTYSATSSVLLNSLQLTLMTGILLLISNINYSYYVCNSCKYSIGMLHSQLLSLIFILSAATSADTSK